MTILELYTEAKKWVDKGYGDKIVVMADGDMNIHIDSVQQNNHSSKKPEYLFLMEGDEYQPKDNHA